VAGKDLTPFALGDDLVLPDAAQYHIDRDIDGQTPVLDDADYLHISKAFLTDNHSPRGKLSLRNWRGSEWRWADGRYTEVTKEELRNEIWQYLGAAKKYEAVKGAPAGTVDTVPFKPVSRQVSDTYDAMKSHCCLPSSVEFPAWVEEVPAAKFNPREILATPNCLVHLPTRTTIPATPYFFNASATDVAYNPAAREPTEWLRFLDSIWVDDPASIRLLRAWVGYLLSSDTSRQKAMMIVGPPRSGKGTIQFIMQELVGRDNMTSPTLSSLATNFGLMPLIGKSLAIVTDARLSGKADQAAIVERILSITGEDSMTIDRKNRPMWEGRLTARFMLMSNETLNLGDASGALASRFMTLAMTRSFLGSEDLGLKDRLRAELPGILNWAIAGYDDLQGLGRFPETEASKAAGREMKASGSPVTEFVEEQCTLAEGSKILLPDLFAAWSDWCRQYGRHPGTSQKFNRDLMASYRGLKKSRVRCGTSSPYVYEGVRLAAPVGRDEIPF